MLSDDWGERESFSIDDRDEASASWRDGDLSLGPGLSRGSSFSID